MSLARENPCSQWWSTRRTHTDRCALVGAEDKAVKNPHFPQEPAARVQTRLPRCHASAGRRQRERCPLAFPGCPQVARWVNWVVALRVRRADDEPKQSPHSCPHPVPSAELESLALDECGSLLCPQGVPKSPAHFRHLASVC